VAMALNGSMHHEIPYAISSLCLILGTSVTLLLLFVPKIYQLRKKDEAVTAQINTGIHLDNTRTRAQLSATPQEQQASAASITPVAESP